MIDRVKVLSLPHISGRSLLVPDLTSLGPRGSVSARFRPPDRLPSVAFLLSVGTRLSVGRRENAEPPGGDDGGELVSFWEASWPVKEPLFCLLLGGRASCPRDSLLERRTLRGDARRRRSCVG